MVVNSIKLLLFEITLKGLGKRCSCRDFFVLLVARVTPFSSPSRLLDRHHNQKTSLSQYPVTTVVSSVQTDEGTQVSADRTQPAPIETYTQPDSENRTATK